MASSCRAVRFSFRSHTTRLLLTQLASSGNEPAEDAAAGQAIPGVCHQADCRRERLWRDGADAIGLVEGAGLGGPRFLSRMPPGLWPENLGADLASSMKLVQALQVDVDKFLKISVPDSQKLQSISEQTIHEPDYLLQSEHRRNRPLNQIDLKENSTIERLIARSEPRKSSGGRGCRRPRPGQVQSGGSRRRRGRSHPVIHTGHELRGIPVED